MAGCGCCIAVIWCSHCQRCSIGDRRGSFMCCPGCGKVLADVIQVSKKRSCSSSDPSTSCKKKKRVIPSSSTGPSNPQHTTKQSKSDNKLEDQARQAASADRSYTTLEEKSEHLHA
ncbi:hypothetical protein Dimus_020132 [Dionaea muscipula]